MAPATQVSLETYLNTVYDPDVDYVDGELEDRNVGHYDHSIVQQQILMWLYLHEREWRIRSVIEQRTQVGATKVRVPDVSVFPRSTPDRTGLFAAATNRRRSLVAEGSPFPNGSQDTELH